MPLPCSRSCRILAIALHSESSNSVIIWRSSHSQTKRGVFQDLCREYAPSGYNHNLYSIDEAMSFSSSARGMVPLIEMNMHSSGSEAIITKLVIMSSPLFSV